MSTAFGCTIQGRVEPAEVLRLVKAALDAGRRPRRPGRHRGLCRPAAGRDAVRAVPRSRGRQAVAAATSTTRAGWAWPTSSRRGRPACARFDACLGGIGGCPHAPGASGNVATEDVAYLFASMGVPTGLDFDALIALRAQIGALARRRAAARRALARRAAEDADRRPRMTTHADASQAAAAAGRAEGGRVHPHGDGPDLRHGAGRPGRRGDQGRADRRRPHAHAAGRGHRLLPDVQPQQEEHRRSTCTSPKAPPWRAGSRPAPTWWPRTSSPARWPSTGSTTPRCRSDNRAPDLRQPQGLPARARTTTAPRSTRWCR